MKKYNPNKKIDNLHCGACMQEFDDIGSLTDHINSCPAAIAMLLMIFNLFSGKDKVGHPLGHFIRNLHENASLIKQYAYAIADKLYDIKRSELHAKVCKKLDLEYNEFRPFNSLKLEETITREEAEEVLWEELSKVSKGFIKEN